VSDKKLVLMDHDGGADDLLSLMMLLTMPHIELIGVAVTPADSYLPFALEASRKILDLLGRSDIQTAGGDLHGVNAFPAAWRAGPHIINALPILLERDEIQAPLAAEPARVFLAQKLKAAPKPVTVLMTGPASNLIAALKAEPDLSNKIAEVVWMAGAVDVAGNVRDYVHNGSAEWNVYWDPPAGKTLMEAKLPLTIFPLDATNHVPVDLNFLRRLAKQRQYTLSDLAAQCWATTINTIPHYDYQYFMWDTLATGYLGCPELITFKRLELSVLADGPNAGQTIPAPGSGQWVNVADKVEVAAFHDYLLEQFRR